MFRAQQEEQEYTPVFSNFSMGTPVDSSVYIPDFGEGLTQDPSEAPEGVYIPQFNIAPQEASTAPTGLIYPEQGRTRQQVTQENMPDIRKYMVLRKGKQFEDKEDDEVYDAFANHMRFFNVNEVTTAGELLFLNKLSDEEKVTVANAYRTFESLGNVFVNDGVLGAVDGVGDYVRGVLTSPSTYLGAIVGRVSIGSASTAARQAAISAMTKEIYQKAATQAAKDQVIGQAAAAAARPIIFKQIGVAGIVDAGANTFQDFLYQTALLDVGAQDDYSVLQSGIAATGGLIGAGVAAAPYLMRGYTSGFEEVGTRLSRAEQKRIDDARANIIPEVEKAAKAFEGKLVDWMNTVQSGQRLAKDSSDLRKFATDTLLDPENPASIPYAMLQAGMTRPQGEMATKVFASFGKDLPEETLNKLDKSFRDSTGVSYSELIDIMAASASEGGQVLSMSAKAARAVAETVASRTAADNLIVLKAGGPAPKVEKDVSPHHIQYLQSLWRRSLVSHPATTAVNIQGWSQAFTARALAEVIHGGILGTAGLVSKLASPISKGANDFADKALFESQALFTAQAYKLKSLLNPYETREMFEAFLDRAPDAITERLNRAGFAGVDMGVASRYNMPDNRVTRKVEGIADAAAQVSGVKVQDAYTKAFSFMGEMNRLVKTNMNTTVEELITKGRVADIPRDLWDKAAEVALRDTFSADFTKGRGTFNHLAKAVEALSNTPFVGFLFPFGRFMNNNLAFIMQYSPIALWPTMIKAKNKGFFAGDTMESMSKMIVGSMALATLAVYQQEKMEKGLQWYQEMSSTGDVYNRENLAPGSAYMLAGHMTNLSMRGETISQDLYRSLWDQLGISRITRDITTNPLDETIGYFLSTFDEEAERVEFTGFLQELAKVSLGDIGSGFTRPFEPLNVFVGMSLDTDTLVDRRQLKGWDAVTKGALRYVDNLFVPFLGEVGPDGRETIGPAQESLTQQGPQREANPLARMMGDRIEQPITDIEKALAAVNIAKWTANERTGIPEWDALLNNRVTPMLNRRAKDLMETKAWKNGNQRTRERLVRSLLQTVKTETRNWIMETGSTDQRLLAERRRFLSLPEGLRAQAKSYTRIDVPDDELTLFQIEVLKQYISDKRGLEKDLIKF